MYTRIPTIQLGLFLMVAVGGAAALGITLGNRMRVRGRGNRESVGVVQAALLGLVGLLLAFGLAMAVGRFEDRRSGVVRQANHIGTTYLRAQLLAEPTRSESLTLLRQYADGALALARSVPRSATFEQHDEELERLHRALWAMAGDAVRRDPEGTAPRLYVDSLNAMIDAHTDRVSSLYNGVPGSVVALEILASAVAVGMLSLYLATLGRSLVSALLSAGLIVVILFVTVDLDRPRRGSITVPDGPLVDLLASMAEAPSATGP